MNRARARKLSLRGDLSLTLASLALVSLIVVFGVLAAMPIYQTASLWMVAGVGAALAFGIVWYGTKKRWGALTLAALVGAFVLIVVPLAVPSALGAGPLGLVRGLGDGLASVALGWKQLLTLSLPLGSYQAVLVPFLVIVFGASAVATALTLLGGRWAPLAALTLIAPVVFGTVFGSSAVSAPVNFGPVSIGAPRELGLWLGAFGFAVAWVAWSSGRERRAALKRGRIADAGLAESSHTVGHVDGSADPHSGHGAVRRNTFVRGLIGGVTILAALAGAFFLAPLVTPDTRTVPRDRVDPEIVVRSGVSPLATYRTWKRDAAFNEPLFTVANSGDGEEDAFPKRLRLAVLSGYDGVDFEVGDPEEVGRFNRFPSGGSVDNPSRLTIEIQPGYADVWVPIAPPLAAPPVFEGPRASALAESFYLNRDTGSAVTVPSDTVEDAGLRDGDGFTATMSAVPDATVGERPVSDQALVDLETMPELARWLKLQELPSSGEGLVEAVDRLRDRGYLSHSLTDAPGENAWLTELGTSTGVTFVSSPGGHSEARIEQLFTQLIEQELAAGDDAKPAMLVAGIGDDEQFAAASALIARAMGFDSRIVVGVRLGPDEENGVPGIPACSDVCTGENLTAWVEVRGADRVWAPLDVSPQIAVPPSMLQKGEQLPEFPTQPEETNATESDPPVGMNSQEGGDNTTSDADNLSALWPVLRIVGLSLLGIALLALVGLFIPVLKRIRLRRRRAAVSPEVSVLGAWDELIDAYRDLGFDPPRHVGRDAVMGELGVSGGDWIAWTVDQAVYSREGITHETAETLWKVVDARISDRRTSLGAWQRLRLRFSLASFGGLRADGFRGVRRSTRTKKALQ
ncbi:MAG: transglutaminase domain-containing protein [Leucobacter sp.]